MMYANRFVATIKVNNQILREQNGVVTIPFGSEYSILLKNLNSVRAMVKVEVDGKDATEGTSLIIHPNSDLELERYIRGGNFERGNRFKFIERTGEIEKHRGIKIDDGLVRVEFKAEQQTVRVPRIHYYDEYVPVPHPWHPWDYPWYPRPYRIWPQTTTGSNIGDVQCTLTNSVGQGQGQVQAGSQNMLASMNCSLSKSSEPNDSGITVAGSESHQKFYSAPTFATESSQVIVLKLRGEVAGKRVAKVVTVKHKPRCSTCGTSNKGTHQFCSKCGTALELI